MLQKMSLAVVRGKRCQHVGLCAGLSDFGSPACPLKNRILTPVWEPLPYGIAKAGE